MSEYRGMRGPVCRRVVVCSRSRPYPQASSRTPPISLKTAVGPPSSRCCVGDHVGDRVDQGQVGEGLREVAEVAAAARLQLLGVEVEPAGGLQQPLAQGPCPLLLADLRERRDEPEGADQEGALLAAQAVVGLLDHVAEDEPVAGQVLGDRLDRVANARVVGTQEAEQRDQEGGGVEGVGLVVLAEDAVANAALEDLLAHALGRRPPLLGDLHRSRCRGRGGRRGRPRPRSSASRRRSDAARRATPRSPGRDGARRRSRASTCSRISCRSAGVPVPRSAFSCR